MSSQCVVLDVDGGTATLTLNDPDRRNAFSREMSRQLHDSLDEIADGDARCVVIQGAGDAFSAGGDIDRMAESLAEDVPAAKRVETLRRTGNRTMKRLNEFPLPTVAKIDGPAVGVGANIAISCDVQLASERSAIGFVFRQVGLGVDTGASHLLPRLVGTNVAKELVMTGEIVDAERALEIGLVNHVYPVDEFDDRVAELVETIATGPTVAFRHSKRLLDEGPEKPLERAMTDEAMAQAILFDTDDHEEGVSAFLDGRSPEFEGA